MKKVWNIIDHMINQIMTFLFTRFLHREYTKIQHTSFMQFIKFGIVGLSNTIISYVLYAVVLLLLQKKMLFPKIDYLLAQIVAFVLSVLWSFYWNNRMVFVVYFLLFHGTVFK